MSNVIAFIDGAAAQLHITFVNEATGKSVAKIDFIAMKLFIDSVPALFNPGKCKAVILNICCVTPVGYSHLYEFRKAITTRLDQMSVPNFYITKRDFVLMQALVAANVNVGKNGDTIINVMSKDDSIMITRICRRSNGYEIIRQENYANGSKLPAAAVRQLILGSSNPTKIILSSGSFGTPLPPKYLIQMLKCKELIIVNREEFIDAGILEAYKIVSDKSNVRYRILPTCSNDYHLGFKLGLTKHQKIVAEFGDALPFSKTITVPKTNLEFYISFRQPVPEETYPLGKFLLKQNGHRNEITLKVNEINLPTYQVKPVILDAVKNLPEMLDKKDGKKNPVIGFYDDSSVICIPKNGDGEYEFLDKWNGMYGKQLLIAFDKEKPSYHDAAAEVYRKKPSYVVSDLFNIMSRSPEEQININEFKITKDVENPILLEFNSFGGTKKLATPAFLMALHLKEHFKAIKEITGEKPSEIGFCFITQSDAQRQERIKKHMEESCELLKVKCSVFDV